MVRDALSITVTEGVLTTITIATQLVLQVKISRVLNHVAKEEIKTKEEVVTRSVAAVTVHPPLLIA
jgi:hypothetical protein